MSDALATPVAPAVPVTAPTPVAAPILKVETPPAAAPVTPPVVPPATPATPAAEVVAKTAEPAKIEPYTIKAPEGFDPNPAVLESFARTSHEQGLTQKQAQALYEAQVKDIAATSTAIGEKWMAEIKAHPTLGGAKAEASMANADKALDRFATPAFAALARQHNLNRNPGMVEFLNAIHTAISPDQRFVTGDVPAVAGSPESFYLNMKKA